MSCYGRKRTYVDERGHIHDQNYVHDPDHVHIHEGREDIRVTNERYDRATLEELRRSRDPSQRREQSRIIPNLGRRYYRIVQEVPLPLGNTDFYYNDDNKRIGRLSGFYVSR